MGIIFKTHKQAKAAVENILTEIKYNREFSDLYGPFDLEVARSDEFAVLNLRTGHRTRVLARGTLQDIRGFIAADASRFTKIIGDDIESELNTGTFDQRRKNRQYLYGAILPALDPEVGKIWLIGTIVHYDSILARIHKRATDEEAVWETHFYQATLDGTLEGEPIWPERFPREELLSIYRTYQEAGEEGLFWQEYMNVPYSDSERALAQFSYFSGTLEDNILTIDGKKQYVTKTIGIDPSLGKEGGDYTGYVLLLTDEHGIRYVYEADALRLPPDAMIDWFFDTVERVKPTSVVLETVAQQEWLETWMREEMRWRNFYKIPLVKIPYNTYNIPKEQRHAMTLSRPLKEGRILIHDRLRDTELVAELMDHPKAAHDDVVDALWLAYKASYPPGAKYKPMEKKKRTLDMWFSRKRKKQPDELNWIVL